MSKPQLCVLPDGSSLIVVARRAEGAGSRTTVTARSIALRRSATAPLLAVSGPAASVFGLGLWRTTPRQAGRGQGPRANDERPPPAGAGAEVIVVERPRSPALSTSPFCCSIPHAVSMYSRLDRTRALAVEQRLLGNSAVAVPTCTALRGPADTLITASGSGVAAPRPAGGGNSPPPRVHGRCRCRGRICSMRSPPRPSRVMRRALGRAIAELGRRRRVGEHLQPDLEGVLSLDGISFSSIDAPPRNARHGATWPVSVSAVHQTRRSDGQAALRRDEGRLPLRPKACSWSPGRREADVDDPRRFPGAHLPAVGICPRPRCLYTPAQA